MHAVLLRFGVPDCSSTRKVGAWMHRVTKKYVFAAPVSEDGGGPHAAWPKTKSPRRLRAWGLNLVVVAGLEPATSAL